MKPQFDEKRNIIGGNEMTCAASISFS